MMQTSPKPAVKLHRKERQKAILEGAAKAFVKHGFNATSLDDIASSAGISRALLYRHFDSKQAIYTAIISDTLHQLRGEAPVEPGVGFGGRQQNLITTAQYSPDGFVLVFRHAVHEPAFQAQAATNNVLRQKYIESNLGDTIPDKKRRAFAAALIRDTLINTLLTWIDNGQPEPERMEHLLDELLQAIVISMADTNK
jgi:AcrR family transcriptional regulator